MGCGRAGFAASAEVQCDVLGEGVQGRADEAGGAIGMLAGSASVDECNKPGRLADGVRLRPPVRQLREGVREGGQTVETRPALAGALLRQVDGDIGGCLQPALSGS